VLPLCSPAFQTEKSGGFLFRRPLAYGYENPALRAVVLGRHLFPQAADAYGYENPALRDV
jgi:hypothetical protein